MHIAAPRLVVLGLLLLGLALACGDPKADARAKTERQLLALMAEHPAGAAERFLSVQEVDRGLGRRLGARAAASLAAAWPDLVADYERQAAGHAVERVRGLVPDAPLELRDPMAQMIDALSAGAPGLARDWQDLQAKVAAAEVRALEAARADQRARLALRIATPGDPGDQIFASMLGPALAEVMAAHLTDVDVFVPDATPPATMPTIGVALALTHADYTGPGAKVELRVLQSAAATFSPSALSPMMSARLGSTPFVLEATAWTPDSILVRPLGGLNLEVGGGSAAVTAMNGLVAQLREALRQRLADTSAVAPLPDDAGAATP